MKERVRGQSNEKNKLMCLMKRIVCCSAIFYDYDSFNWMNIWGSDVPFAFSFASKAF